MASCGRDEAEIEAGTSAADVLVAKPKPGSSCAVNSVSNTNAAVGSNGGYASTGCKSKSGSKGSCGHRAAAPSSSSPEAAQALPLSGGIPPPRVREAAKGRQRALCYRCKERPSQVVLHEFSSCAPCFTTILAGRAKAALRGRCQLAKGANVLVGVSGGSASSCLAHVLADACDPDANNKNRMFFAFEMVHVDESAVLLGNEDDHARFRKQLTELFGSSPPLNKQRLLIVRLEDVMALGTEREEETFAPLVLRPSTDATTAATGASSTSSSAAAVSVSDSVAQTNRTALQRLFSSLKDMSDKGDLLELLRLRLLGHVARLRGFGQVLLGSDATQTAVACFADTSKGRGAHVSLNVAPREWRFQCELAYPLREIHAQHVALYNHFRRVSPIHRPYFLPLHKSALATAGGLNKLAHDFLCMLDAKFSSSVSNVVHTVGKLALPAEYVAGSSSAAAASSPTGSAAPKSKALAEVSAELLGMRLPVIPGSHCALCGRARVAAEADTARTAQAAVAASRLAPSAANAALLEKVASCYGCTALLRELSDASALPSFVLSGAHADHRRPPPAEWQSQAPSPGAENGGAPAASPSWLSTYPAPFNATISTDVLRAENARTRAQRDASKAARERERQAEAAAAAAENGAEAEGADDAPFDAEAMADMADSAAAAAASASPAPASSPSVPPLADDQSQSARLQLQSRADMKASIDEYLL